MRYCHRLLLPNPQFAASVIDFEESAARRAEYGGDLLTVVCHDGVEFSDPGIWRLSCFPSPVSQVRLSGHWVSTSSLARRALIYRPPRW